MAITFRLKKGKALTHQELDDNFRFFYAFSETETYTQGMVVNYNDKFYKADNDITVAGPFNAGEWTEQGAISGSLNTLGTPTDGTYGGDNKADVQIGESVEDGVDKIVTLLDKITPNKPPLLSAVTPVITGSFSAYKADEITPLLITTIIDEAQVVEITTSEVFQDPDEGTLSVKKDSVSNGSITLTTGDDSGTNGLLTINSEDDYPSVSEPVWVGLNATINDTTQTASATAYSYDMIHSTTGTMNVNLYRDNPLTPIINTSATPFIGTTSDTRYISGVPSMETGETIACTFTVNNAISYFYNAIRIARVESTLTNNLDVPLPGTPPTEQSNYTVTGFDVIIATGSYSEDFSATLIGYNSIGTSGQSTVASGNIRVDTISDETIRVISGVGQYPGTGYGGSFDETIDLTTASNEELQMVNSSFQYPSGNYTTNLPTAGPNYSSVPAGSYSNFRWATFDLGTITTETSVTLNIIDSSNLGTNPLITGWRLYVKVEGDTDWVDANADYIGSGDPINNGDAALDVSGSLDMSDSLIVRRVTFGTIARSGTLYVRAGIPSGSNKTFKNITLV